MKPVFQTIFDANGGNCLSAAIASILELPIDAVPNFARDHGDDWERATAAWLRSRRLRLLSIGFAAWETFCLTHFDNPGEYCLVSGPSGYPDRGHAVVGRVTAEGGIEVAHDPIPGGRGPLQGHRWVNFIVPLPDGPLPPSLACVCDCLIGL